MLHLIEMASALNFTTLRNKKTKKCTDAKLPISKNFDYVRNVSEPYRLMESDNAIYTPPPPIHVTIPPPPISSPTPSLPSVPPVVPPRTSSLFGYQQLPLSQTPINTMQYQLPVLPSFNPGPHTQIKTIVGALRGQPYVDDRTLALVNIADHLYSGVKGYDNGQWLVVSFKPDLDYDFKDAIVRMASEGKKFQSVFWGVKLCLFFSFH